MTLFDAAKKLGIEDLPDGMEACFHKVANFKDQLCSDELIDDLQEKFDFFGTYYALVKKAYRELLKSEEKKIYLDTASVYYLENDHDVAIKLPLPKTDGTPSGDFFALFVLLPSIFDAYDNYRERGFSHEETVKNLDNFKLNIWIVEKFILSRPAIIGVYYRWLSNYAKCRIFDHGGLNFQIKKAPKSAMFIKNKKTGETKILLRLKGVHKTGMPLNSAGFEDEEGSYSADFEETETEFIGNPIENFRIQKEKKHFSKEEWALGYRPGDDVIGIHIPRSTDLSPEKISAAYKEALEIFKRSYPEFSPKAFYCASWLMDPTLNEILGENSKISSFSAPYQRHPNRNDGRDIFGYVFPNGITDFSLLPEKTSLQRKLKEKYLKGEYIYSYTGAIILEQ